MPTCATYLTGTSREVLAYLSAGMYLKSKVPELNNFAACITTRFFYEPIRGLSVLGIVVILPTPLFSFFLVPHFTQGTIDFG